MKVLWIMIACFALQACGRGDSESKLKQEIESMIQKNRQTNQAPSVKPLLLPQPATYQAASLKAPFTTTDAAFLKKGASLSPLQAFPLSALNFLGTISKMGEMIAIIETPNKMIYEIKKGDMLGDNYGKVVRIMPEAISVAEVEVKDGKPAMEHVSTLTLKPQ